MKTKLTQKKVIVPLVILFLVAIGTVVGLILSSQEQDISSSAAPNTRLAVQTTSQSFNVGQDFNAEVRMDTGDNYVAGADVYFTFDPNVLRLNSISLGEMMADAQIMGQNIDNSTGTAYIMAMLTLDRQDNLAHGAGNILNLRFTAMNSGTANIAVDERRTDIGGLGEERENASVLLSASGATVNVEATGGGGGNEGGGSQDGGGNGGGGSQDGGGTATPAPTPTPTATPKPTSTPKVTPTPTPTPTPPPTPRPTPTPPQPATPSTLPQSGSVDTTIALAGGGILFLIAGAFSAYMVKNQ